MWQQILYNKYLKKQNVGRTQPFVKGLWELKMIFLVAVSVRWEMVQLFVFGKTYGWDRPRLRSSIRRYIT
jgi:hypothetical protein